MGLSTWLKQNIGCPFAKHAVDPGSQTANNPVGQSNNQQLKPQSFLASIQEAEDAHPLLQQPFPPDPKDPKYQSNPAAYNQDKQDFDDALAKFTDAAKARGGAVAGVMGLWLATKPLEMLQELLDQPADVMPIFKPVVGPVIVMRHEHVIKCLERTDLFTVDRYAPEMARATDDKAKCPGAFSHFMLGTDNDELYRPDGVLLRHVVTPNDKDVVTRIARNAANDWLAQTLADSAGVIDIVTTIARDVPLRIVSDYFGVPAYNPGEASVLPGLYGGDTLPLNDNLQKVFTFQKISQGIVPTWDHLHSWIQDAFRNIFNNNNAASPDFQEFRDRGIIATEYLSNYIHELIELYKAKLQAGETIPDTMLTRFLRLQADVLANKAQPLEQEYAYLLGQPLPSGEMAKRLSDSMIRSNVFGTAVGAVANPQEAMTRIADVILGLKEDKYQAGADSDYELAIKLAKLPEEHPDFNAASEILKKYALEALRLQPQGEIVLRVCVQDNTELANVPIKKGTVVFVGHAGAMRDKAVLDQPLQFDVNRGERLTAYLGNADRKNEDPQSQIYLQHGYGRHKCLGRYASEITMQESLRVILRLDNIKRESEVIMDAQNNYPVSFKISFTV